MIKFKYAALTADGSSKSGSMEGASVSDVVDRIRAEGYFVTDIVEVSQETASPEINLGFLTGVSKKEIALMFRQLGVLLKAGVSILQSIHILRKQSRKRSVKRMLLTMGDLVEGGVDFSEAMSRSGCFSLYDVSMVKAGEESGELDVIVETVADQMEKGMAFKAQMITGMIYPAVVTVMSILVMIILSVFVIPRFTSILGGQGKSLPAITQALLNFTDWMGVYWSHILGSMAGLFFGVPLLKKTEGGAYLVDWISLKIPLIGGIVKSAVVVNFTRNLSILLKSGVPMSDAVLTVKDTLGNAVAGSILLHTCDDIMAGESMADSLRRHERIFPPMVAEMVATGEETGEMVEVLELTAKIYQTMMEAFVKRMNALIEPALILVMGGMVGFVVIALMAGVMEMYG